MKRRFLSLILTIAMAISVLPNIVVQAQANINIGDYLQMGTYYGEPILWRCVSFEKIIGYDDAGNPIMDATDTVTEYQDGYLPLLLSDKIICIKVFDTQVNLGEENKRKGSHIPAPITHGSNYWGDSSIRQWLNSEESHINWWYNILPDNEHTLNPYDNEQGFLKNFTTKELNIINTVAQDTIIDKEMYVSVTLGMDWREYTNNEKDDYYYKERFIDNFFLLDEQQFKNMLKNESVLGEDYLKAKLTKCCYENCKFDNDINRIPMEPNYYWYYWLRTPASARKSQSSLTTDNGNTVSVMYIDTDGRLNSSHNNTLGRYGGSASGHDNSNGIRPAFYLDINNALFVSGNGTESNPYTIDNSTSGNMSEPSPEPTQAPFSGLPETLEIGIDTTVAPTIDLNRNNATLTIADPSVADIEESTIHLEPIDGYVPPESTIFNIIPKAPGETTLTAIAPDGSTLKGKLIVKPIIAEDITDEIVMRAKVLSNNDRYKYYKNVYQSPSKLTNDSFKDNGTESWASAYLIVNEMAKLLTLKLPSGEKLDTEKYYETILADILENSTSSENGANVWDNTYSAWNKIYKGYNNDILQKIAGKVTDLEGVKTSKFFKDHTDKKVIDTIIDYSKNQGELKEIKIEADILDKISLSADLISDFFDSVDEMLAYSAVQQEKINVLKDLQNTTANDDLAKACENLIKDIEFAHRNTVAYFATEFGKGAGKDILDFSHGCVMGVVLGYLTTDTAGVTPYVPGLKEAMAIVNGVQAFTNIVINADGISEKILANSAYAYIEEELKWITNRAETSFTSDPTVEKAVNFMGHADMLKATLLTSCDIYADLAEEVQKGTKRQNIVRGILDLFAMNANDIINLMNTGFKDTNIEDNIQSCKTSKRYIEEADFYKLYDDITAYISTERSKTPSGWAKEYVDKAINYKIVPDYLQCNYQNNITRAEFCALLTNLIIQKTGINSIDELPTYNRSNELFKDTYYTYVYYMYCLGIVNGVNEEEFQPLGYITREQAATMLKRTADALGIDSTAPNKNQDGISDWAKDGVSFVVDRGIMNGTDNGFEPQGTYTKEQALTTFVRFFENL